MIYLSSVLVFGLMQIWILLGILTFKDVDYSCWDLIKDGVLFIFASSLAISTFISHRKLFRTSRVPESESYWSFLYCFIILGLCFLGFSTSIDTHQSSFDIRLNDKQNIAQLISSGLAIIYGFVVEKRLEKAVG